MRPSSSTKNQDRKRSLEDQERFEDWRREQGSGWETSVRNRTKAVTKLNASLDKVADYRTYQITHFTIPELMALSGASVSESQLIEFCRSQLAHYKCPHSVDVVDSLPKTGTGKVLKKNLRNNTNALHRLCMLRRRTKS
jgi:acyl-CoA synthetase (AMP-forming)/AMP-acid ligase II